MAKRLFSGIQPSGDIHIGNYLGALRNWVALIPEFECIYCIVDYHAITIPYEPSEMQSRILGLAAVLIGCGIDPDRCTLFVQSHVPEHTELAWILNTVTPVGDLFRMTQFKEKSAQFEGSVNAGLLNYPVLQAADILLYKGEVVPVGEDQVQHLELSREIARRFNARFGPLFPEPQARLTAAARIMGLDDPTKKMSKSEANEGHAINLLDPPDAIRAKLMRATTDSQRDVVFDENRPGIFNLLTIYQLFSGQTPEQIERHFYGKGYAVLKQELADLVIEGLRPLQTRYRELMADPSYLERLLADGANKVRPLAEKTLRTVMERVGLG